MSTLTAEKIGMKSVSPTKLQDYEDCPLMFYYKHWLGLSLEQDKLHMDFGNAVQDSIEKIYAMFDYQFGNGWGAEQHRFPEIQKAFLKDWTIHQVPEESFKKYMTTRAGKESGYTEREHRADMLSFYVQVKSILTKIANREFPRGSSGHQNYCDCYKYEEALKINKE
jgi:hypothetical protein